MNTSRSFDLASGTDHYIFCLLPRSSQVQKHISKATVHAYKTKKVVEKDEEWKNQDNMNNLVDLWGV